MAKKSSTKTSFMKEVVITITSSTALGAACAVVIKTYMCPDLSTYYISSTDFA